MTCRTSSAAKYAKTFYQVLPLAAFVLLSACKSVVPTEDSGGGLKEENMAPVSASQSVSTDEDLGVAITLASTDVEGDALTYSVVAGPSNGSFSGTAPELTYTPNANFNGVDSFTFKANDGSSDSNTATISISVNPVNDAPLAEGQSVNVSYNTATAITLAGTDVDGDSIASYTVVSGPSHGSLTGSASSLTYTPTAAYTGADAFTFKVNDGSVDSSTATVSITVASTYTIYLRSSGDDGVAVVGDISKPYLTAQAAVNAAIAQVSGAAHRVVMDVGSLNSGNFGDITLTQDFGQYVDWVGVDSTHSVIGNVVANGANGTDAVDDGNGTPASGQDGFNGFAVHINAASNVKFGNITSNGGRGGANFNPGMDPGIATTSGGGNGGVIAIGANAIIGHLTANGGIEGPGAEDLGTYGTGGGRGGTITVAAGAQAGNVTALGGGIYKLMRSATFGGAGGSVTINGTVGIVNVTGGTDTLPYDPYARSIAGDGGSVLVGSTGQTSTIIADGGIGSNAGEEYKGNGNGGTVSVSGVVTGFIHANGGDDEAQGGSSGGSGGTITLNNGATVSGNIAADGGTGYATGASGGTITVNNASVVGNITADGGRDYGGGYDGNNVPGSSGGTVTLNSGATITGSITAKGSDAGTPISWYAIGGNGGTITLNTGSSVTQALNVNGGSGGEMAGGGNGGTITIHAPATYGSASAAAGGNGDTANGYTNGSPGAVNIL